MGLKRTIDAADEPSLSQILGRSDELEQAAWSILELHGFELNGESDRVEAACRACEVSIEHGRSLRLLISVDNRATAAAVLRLQFEATVRAIWLLYSATEAQVQSIQAAPGDMSDKDASDVPMVGKMIKELDGTAPPMAFEMASGFKQVLGAALNSHVHTGSHVLQRHARGFSPRMLARLVQHSNGLFTMAAMLLANVAGDDAAAAMRAIQTSFADCLPELVPPTAPPGTPVA